MLSDEITAFYKLQWNSNETNKKTVWKEKVDKIIMKLFRYKLWVCF